MFMGRLMNVRKQEDNHRKFMCVMNDVARNQHIFYNSYISKELQYNISQQDRHSVIVKKAAAQKRVLQKCLEMKREDTLASKDKGLYGHYGGKPIHALTKEMDTFLAERHPKIRKKQNIDNVMKKSRERGIILSSAKMSEKVREYFTEKWGVVYPAQKDKKKVPTFKKKEELTKDIEPSVTLSDFFKLSLFPRKHQIRKFDESEVQDGELTGRTDQTGHSSTDTAQYILPGEDKHWNCKRCYHVDKVKRSKSRRAISEHTYPEETNRLVLPDLQRPSSSMEK